MFNPLWPGDAILRYRSRPRLARAMACCLTAPNHYLNQFWLRISKCFMLFTASALVIILYNAMMTSSNGNIFSVTGPLCGEFTGPGEFPTQRPVTRSFDVLFDLRLNKRLSKQPWGWWFETPSWSLWRQYTFKFIATSPRGQGGRFKRRLLDRDSFWPGDATRRHIY